MATIGPAVLNGGITTFIAVVPLMFSTHYAFLGFFKVFFLAVIFGLFHGLVFLPVTLVLFGNEKAEMSEENNCVNNDGSNNIQMQSSTKGETNPGFNSSS